MSFINTIVGKLGNTFSRAQARSESVLGLVVRDDSIQLARMKITKTGHKLSNLVYWSVNVPDKTSNPVLEQPDFYAKQIKQALDLAAIQKANVVLVVPGHHVQLVNAAIPQFSLAEMETMEPEALADFLPEQFAEISQYQLAWQVQSQGDENGEMAVLFGLLKKDILEKYLEIARLAGLLPVIVDVDVLASANVYYQNEGFDGHWRAHISLTSARSNTLLVTNGSESQLHTFSIEEADLILLRQAETMSEVNGPFWAELGHRIANKINPILAAFESQQSDKIFAVNFHTSAIISHKTEQLLAQEFVGFACVDALKGLEVPVESLKFSDAVDNKSFFAPVIGAAKRRFNAFYQDHTRGFELNFSPYALALEKHARFSLFNTSLLVMFGVVVTLVIATFGTQDIPEYLHQKQQLKGFEVLTKKIQSQQTIVQGLQAKLSDQRQKFTYLTSVTGNSKTYQNLVTNLTALSNGKITFQRLQINTGTIQVQAEAVNLAEASAFVDRLNTIPKIHTVQFEAYENGNFGVSFVMEEG